MSKKQIKKELMRELEHKRAQMVDRLERGDKYWAERYAENAFQCVMDMYILEVITSEEHTALNAVTIEMLYKDKGGAENGR